MIGLLLSNLLFNKSSEFIPRQQQLGASSGVL